MSARQITLAEVFRFAQTRIRCSQVGPFAIPGMDGCTGFFDADPDVGRSKFSCDGISQACFMLVPQRMRRIRSALNEKALSLAHECGLPKENVFSLFDDVEDVQGARLMWLEQLALIAEEERL